MTLPGFPVISARSGGRSGAHLPACEIQMGLNARSLGRKEGKMFCFVPFVFEALRGLAAWRWENSGS